MMSKYQSSEQAREGKVVLAKLAEFFPNLEERGEACLLLTSRVTKIITDYQRNLNDASILPDNQSRRIIAQYVLQNSKVFRSYHNIQTIWARQPIIFKRYIFWQICNLCETHKLCIQSHDMSFALIWRPILSTITITIYISQRYNFYLAPYYPAPRRRKASILNFTRPGYMAFVHGKKGRHN